MIAATVDNHLCGIWCELKQDAGVDHRASWLKSGDGGLETFCTFELAQAGTDQLEQEADCCLCV
jgi:hypothetical protein